MDVHTCALIMLAATPALVTLGIAQQVIVMDVQKLMNVPKEQMDVLTLVQTQLGAIPAPVIQGIAWQVMDGHVMVSDALDLHWALPFNKHTPPMDDC